MGKADRKLRKNMQRKQEEERNTAMSSELAGIEKLIDSEKYAEALNEMPKLVEMHCKNPRFLYDAAYCYFMTGDYERAVKWLNNTLTLDSADVKARILLARICLLEDRTNDALTIFDFVLGSFAGALSDGDKEDVEEILDYYVASEANMLRTEYPNIAEYFGLDKEPEAEAEPQEKAAPAAKAPGAEQDVQALIRQVMEQNVSLAEKVRILNSFAGAFYMGREYEKVKTLLNEALKIDMQNEYTIRNMIYLLLAMGRNDEAMQWAAKMPVTDFALLDKIQSNG